MKQNLFNKLWLRVGMIVAIMTTALSGTAWADEVTDVLTATSLAATSTSYTDFSNVSFTSDAVYAGNSAKTSKGGIQLRSKNSNSGIVSTTSGGKVKSVSITVESGSNTVDVYGSNTAYTAASDLYGDNKGTKLGSLSANSTTVTVEGDYAYVGIRSNNGAIYLTDITIVWEVAGGSTPTCATPTFSPAAGTYTEAQSVTISTTTSDATIYYTTDGSTPSNASTQYTGAIPVSTTTTIKAMAVASGYNNSSVASATYTIVSLDHAGTEADPYTVADARTLLTAAPSTTFEDVYVSGIISQVDSYNSTYKSITYWISDDGTTTDQFEVYSGKGLNGADFSSKDDLIVGSEVTVKGNIKKYNSTFEFDVNSQIVSLDEPTYPIINVENATLNLAYDATSGEIEYTITNPTSATLTATSNASWISNITVGASSVTFTTTANNGTTDREATITLSYTGAEDVTVTVTQGHYVADYATLPFEFDGGRADIETTDGLTQDGLESDYGSSPKLKFNGTGDNVILHFNERPGTLTFDIKGNPGGNPSIWAGEFKVQTSVDGTTYTDLAIYDDLTSTVLSEEFTNLGENVRYIKWIYTEKSSGNVALGNIKLAKYGEAQTYTLSWTAGEHSEIFVFDAEDDSEPLTSGVSVAEGTTIYVSVGADEGYEISALTVKDANNSTITLSEVGENYYSFEMPASNVTITSTATQSGVTPVTGDKYVKVTSTTDLTDGQYLIVYEEGSVAFNGGLETLDAVGNTINVTISNNEIAADATTNAASFTIDVAAGTILSASGKYIGVSTNSNGLKQTEDADTYTHTFSTDANGNAVIAAVFEGSTMALRYNKTSGQTRFRYFKNAGQEAIQLYKFVEATTPETESVTVTPVGYATYCSANALDFSGTGITAYVGTIDGTHLTFTPITQVPANTGLLLKAEGGATVDVPVIASAPELTITNCLTGVNVATTLSEDDYILNVVNGKAGFYKAGTHTSLAAHRAYISADAGQGVKSFIFDDDDATAIGTVESFTEEGAIFNLAGQRLQKMQKGINIVNGKKIFK